jgi:hypothetical protein
VCVHTHTLSLSLSDKHTVEGLSLSLSISLSLSLCFSLSLSLSLSLSHTHTHLRVSILLETEVQLHLRTCVDTCNGSGNCDLKWHDDLEKLKKNQSETSIFTIKFTINVIFQNFTMTWSAREARRELLAWITEGLGFKV